MGSPDPAHSRCRRAPSDPSVRPGDGPMQELLHVVRRSLRLATDMRIGISKACFDEVSHSGIESSPPTCEMPQPENRIASDDDVLMRREAHADGSRPLAVFGVKSRGKHRAEQFLRIVALEGRLDLRPGHSMDDFVFHRGVTQSESWTRT